MSTRLVRVNLVLLSDQVQDVKVTNESYQYTEWDVGAAPKPSHRGLLFFGRTSFCSRLRLKNRRHALWGRHACAHGEEMHALLRLDHLEIARKLPAPFSRRLPNGKNSEKWYMTFYGCDIVFSWSESSYRSTDLSFQLFLLVETEAEIIPKRVEKQL